MKLIPHLVACRICKRVRTVMAARFGRDDRALFRCEECASAPVTPPLQPVQIESAAEPFVPGQRVVVEAGTYRTGETANSHVSIDRSTGTVRLFYPETRLNPARVLVYLDRECLPNRFAPSTAVVPPARVRAA